MKYETAKPSGTPPKSTGDNTSMHKLLAMGKDPKVSVPSPKTRP